MSARIYTLMIGDRPVLCFPAHSYRDAQSLLKEDWLRADLRATTSGGTPLWDGREKLTVRNADNAEEVRFQTESTTLPSQEDDLPIVYLVELAQRGKGAEPDGPSRR